MGERARRNSGAFDRGLVSLSLSTAPADYRTEAFLSLQEKGAPGRHLHLLEAAGCIACLRSCGGLVLSDVRETQTGGFVTAGWADGLSGCGGVRAGCVSSFDAFLFLSSSTIQGRLRAEPSSAANRSLSVSCPGAKNDSDVVTGMDRTLMLRIWPERGRSIGCPPPLGFQIPVISTLSFWSLLYLGVSVQKKSTSFWSRDCMVCC